MNMKDRGFLWVTALWKTFNCKEWPPSFLFSGDIALENLQSQGVSPTSFLVQGMSLPSCFALPPCSGPSSPKTYEDKPQAWVTKICSLSFHPKMQTASPGPYHYFPYFPIY